MAAVSGQNNAYKINLHHSVAACPVAHIWIHTNRHCLKDNYITLGIPDSLKVEGALVPVSAYVVDRLQGLGAHLQTWRRLRWDKEVLAGRATVKDEIPSHIQVANYVNARGVIDDLFAHGEMSAGDRADIEDALRELEESARFAGQTVGSISIAQKDIIHSVVSPYLDEIKSEAPSSQTAKDWVKSASIGLTICGPNIIDNLSSLLWTHHKSGHDRSTGFYESLLAIAKIYSGMGDLEGALEQLGEALPEKALVQEAIFSLFD